VAASRMEYHEVGALAVLDDGELVGIITERDIGRAVAEARDPWLQTVGEFMTPDPVTVSPVTSLGLATSLMLEIGARHLPVVEGGRTVGMISVRDLLAMLVLGGLEEAGRAMRGQSVEESMKTPLKTR